MPCGSLAVCNPGLRLSPCAGGSLCGGLLRRLRGNGGLHRLGRCGPLYIPLYGLLPGLARVALFDWRNHFFRRLRHIAHRLRLGLLRFLRL